MTEKKNDRSLLRELVRITGKELIQLSKTADRIQKQLIDLSWVLSLETNDDRSEMLDAFVSRFGRLQDTLGDKLLPLILRASLEKTGTQLDNLFRAEKMGWIESAQSWIENRELRNRLIHEYMESPEDLLEAVRQALEGVAILREAQRRLSLYALDHLCQKGS
ncbi:MAG: hypothetical protein ACYDAM_10140 [Leptospirales bacterium]